MQIFTKYFKAAEMDNIKDLQSHRDELINQVDKLDKELDILYQEREIETITKLADAAMIAVIDNESDYLKYINERLNIVETERHNYPNIHHHGYSKLIGFWYRQKGFDLKQKDLLAIGKLLGISGRKIYINYMKYKDETPEPTKEVISSNGKTRTEPNNDYKHWQQAKRMHKYCYGDGKVAL